MIENQTKKIFNKQNINRICLSKNKKVTDLILFLDMSIAGFYAMLSNGSIKLKCVFEMADFFGLSICEMLRFAQHDSSLIVNEPENNYGVWKELAEARKVIIELKDEIEKLKNDNFAKKIQ